MQWRNRGTGSLMQVVMWSPQSGELRKVIEGAMLLNCLSSFIQYSIPAGTMAAVVVSVSSHLKIWYQDNLYRHAQTLISRWFFSFFFLSGWKSTHSLPKSKDGRRNTWYTLWLPFCSFCYKPVYPFNCTVALETHHFPVELKWQERGHKHVWHLPKCWEENCESAATSGWI